MSSINWNNGQLTTLREGDTATCDGELNKGQLYCLFFYNSAQNDADTIVRVTWSNSEPPITITVPGTTAKQGLATLCFVDGDSTNTVSASVTQSNPGAKIQAFIGSVKMPKDTKGINNKTLPLDGREHNFEKFTRFYSVPESHWYSTQIKSNINQFICVQLSSKRAKVFVVNKLQNPDDVVYYTGNSKESVETKYVDSQYVTFDFQGNGKQTVWINADSIQNSDHAHISIQSLALE